MNRLSPSKRVATEIGVNRLSPWFFSSIAVLCDRRKRPLEADSAHFSPATRSDCRQSDGLPSPVYRRDFGHLSTDFRGSSSIAVTFPVYRRDFDSSIAVAETRLSPIFVGGKTSKINDLQSIFRALTRARVNAFFFNVFNAAASWGQAPAGSTPGPQAALPPGIPQCVRATARSVQARLRRAAVCHRMRTAASGRQAPSHHNRPFSL